MSLFEKLKNWTDDDPNGLADLAKGDESILKLCLAVYQAASDLNRDEQRKRQLFTMPVDPNFIKLWRDYKERYEPILTEVDFVDFFCQPFIKEPSKLPKRILVGRAPTKRLRSGLASLNRRSNSLS